MKIKIALFMIASAVAIGAGIARAEDVSSKNTHVGIRAPGETGQQTRVLHSLALALSDGNEAMDFCTARQVMLNLTRTGSIH